MRKLLCTRGWFLNQAWEEHLAASEAGVKKTRSPQALNTADPRLSSPTRRRRYLGGWKQALSAADRSRSNALFSPAYFIPGRNPHLCQKRCDNQNKTSTLKLFLFRRGFAVNLDGLMLGHKGDCGWRSPAHFGSGQKRDRESL
jgi:hypothetical protein